MKQNRKSRVLALRAGLLLVAVAGLSLGCAGTPETGSPMSAGTTATPAGGRELTPVNPPTPAEAKAILLRMARFLASAQSFRVDLVTGYDVVQASGQKIEFGEARQLTVRRPNGLRVEVERSDGDRGLVVFDGKALTIYNATENVYATAAQPGDLDEAVIHFVRDLKMRLPLAMLWVARLPEEIEQRVQSVDYVERSTLLGVPTDHLAARTSDVDFQVWVAVGDQPLPQRVVITYKNAEGQPQFHAQFANWNLQPQIAESLFAFSPPQNAERIPFLAELRQAAAGRPGAASSKTRSATEQTGVAQ